MAYTATTAPTPAQIPLLRILELRFFCTVPTKGTRSRRSFENVTLMALIWFTRSTAACGLGSVSLCQMLGGLRNSTYVGNRCAGIYIKSPAPL